jgi:predicted dithiol-disulfide oxidoreductase (DUF899 family)
LSGVSTAGELLDVLIAAGAVGVEGLEGGGELGGGAAIDGGAASCGVEEVAVDDGIDALGEVAGVGARGEFAGIDGAVEEGGDAADGVGDDAALEGPDERVAGGCGGERDPHDGFFTAGFVVGQQRGQPGRQGGELRRSAWCRHGTDELSFGGSLESAEDQLGSGRVVVLHGADRDTSRGGDATKAQRVEAVARDHCDRAVDDPVTHCTPAIGTTNATIRSYGSVSCEELTHPERTSAMPTHPSMPPVVDRATFMAARDALLAREKAHTREGDSIAAARRRLPMVEVDASIEVVGPDGPITIADVFEGRKQLIAYYHAWNPGEPAAGQCEGCTFFNSQVRELSYLHSRDITYAVLCKGPYDQSTRYRDFLGLEMPWYSVEATAPQLLEGRNWQIHHLVCYLREGDKVYETYYTGGRGVEVMAPTIGLWDMTVYGRQEAWEDSPQGWLRAWAHSEDTNDSHNWRTNGRPIAQWARIESGHDDTLT